MGVAGRHTIAVIELDQVAVGPFAGCIDNTPGRSGHDGRATGASEVEAFVHAIFAGDRVLAHAKAGRQPQPLYRRTGWQSIKVVTPQGQFRMAACKRINTVEDI